MTENILTFLIIAIDELLIMFILLFKNPQIILY